MIKAIFATDIHGGMGKDGTLPWPHDKQDMQWFSSNTKGHVVVMGSNTWCDPKMPKPLPDRHCVVVTNQPIENFAEAHDVIAGNALLPSLEVLKLQHPDKDVWIIGGAKLIESTKHLFEQIYLTTFDNDFNCDIKLNVLDLLDSYVMNYETYGKDKVFSVWTRAKL